MTLASSALTARDPMVAVVNRDISRMIKEYVKVSKTPVKLSSFKK